MAIMVGVFYQSGTVFWDGRGHEFADQAAEVCRHHKRFESLNFLRRQLHVYESKKVDETLHRRLDMAHFTAKGELCRPVEFAGLYRHGGASQRLKIGGGTWY